MWGIIQSIVVMFTVFALIIAVVAQLAYLGLQRYFPHLSPERRARLLVLLACSPVLIAFTLVALIFSPSLMTFFGLAADHCFIHGNHHAHLCFIHPPAFIENPWVITLSLFVFTGALWRMIKALKEIRRGKQLLKQLKRNCRIYPNQTNLNQNYRLVEGDLILACSMGMLRSEIFISRKLQKHLSQDELNVILAHEKAHARRKDFLLLFFSKLFSVFFIPGLSKRVMSDIDLACEQACDEFAKQQAGSSLLVAKTITKVQRLMPDNNRFEMAAMNFSRAHIAQRVLLLLKQTQRSKLHNGIFPRYVLMGSAFTLLLLNYKTFHHYIESLYFSLF